MLKKAGSLHKNNLRLSCNSSVSIVFLVILTFLLSFNIHAAADYNPYIPVSPSGNTNGDINVDYEYVFYTIDVGSFWMFDWGDGTYSDWIRVGESDTYVSQTHAWNSYGIYEVRIKHVSSSYIGESAWSPSLTVAIAIPSDLDGDGWNNKIEEAYGKNPEDPNEYPLDTDSDGTPDDDSSDGAYAGDSDDDNDGLSDSIEETLGSNTKNSNDVLCIVIGETIYHLVGTDEDGDFDILYNQQIELQTKTNVEDGKTYLDINNDGAWDYTYHGGAIARYKAPFPWLYVIAAVILIAAAVVFLLFKIGVLYLYEEECIVED